MSSRISFSMHNALQMGHSYCASSLYVQHFVRRHASMKSIPSSYTSSAIHSLHLLHVNPLHDLQPSHQSHLQSLPCTLFTPDVSSVQKRFFLKNLYNKFTNTTEESDAADTKKKFSSIDLSKKGVIGQIRDHKDVAWQLGNLPSGQITKLINSQDGKLFMTPSEPLLREFSMQLKHAKLYSDEIRNLNNQPFNCIDLWRENEISVLSLSFTAASRKWISHFHQEISKLEDQPNTKWSIRMKHSMNDVLSTRKHVSYLNMIVTKSYWERKFFGDKMALRLQKDVDPQFYPNTMLILDPLEQFIADMRLRNVYTCYIFIIDSKGWIRWACSGKPNERDIASFSHVLTRLCTESNS